ncbi:Mechanosensitive ion channel protein [Mycena sanguinolenta]|uniref:Mechanosensitive ion channel protein n=1 Tax=Mycena sanguinolenta TaxID=230812 RepID=A0A8H6ZEY2_9AGAR|nr:Mechanosensitive ion channel protein [Mycena sanguinolenta]
MAPQKYDPVDFDSEPHTASHSYPPDFDRMAIPMSSLSASSSRTEALHFDPERGATTNGKHTSGSWDYIAGMGRKIEHSYEEFDPARNASEPHLAFADGDVPTDKASTVSKLYNYLLNASIVSRWILFIVPVLGLIWIPGIIVLTSSGKLHEAQVSLTTVLPHLKSLTRPFRSGVSAFCGGQFGCPSAGEAGGLLWRRRKLHFHCQAKLNIHLDRMIIPGLIRRTCFARYVALFIWTWAVFISYQPLINSRQSKTASASSIKIISLGSKLFFAFLVCAGILLFEKFSIQWIAGKFHERSYAERIADQKFAVKSVVTLYRNSRNVGRADALQTDATTRVRFAATTTTTAFGNVASEITGTSVLQPNSPQSIVKTALESANRSRLLARRLYYSFTKPNAEYMIVEDIQQFFPTRDEADQVFALFDKDFNGDATRDEVEMAMMDLHREQLSIEHSMQDLDSAVGRLDNIFMSVYVIIAILIIAVALEAQLATLITSASTLVLGLSWLIGGTLTEILTSIIFLFVKHPFDVGDRIVVEGTAYTVKEIRLLSTIFINGDGVAVQAPNSVLNGQFIENYRRSSQVSESFTFDVGYSTSFEDVEKLREKMLAFVTAERRDYQPAFDVVVVDFPDQSKMTLSATIPYKGNGQQGALKAKRRNKWLCALKASMAEVGIYGPSGNPNAEPGTQRYTQVPWHEVKAASDKASKTPQAPEPAGGWELSGKNAIILDGQDDIFADPDELHMPSPRQPSTPSQTQSIMMPTASRVPS